MLLRRARTGAPDFIGVGTQRSGTTWWFTMLIEHPDVLRPTGTIAKELHAFDRFAAQAMDDADVRAYHRRFPPRRRGQVSGEWTPRYMYDVWTPRLLARAAPEARLLVLLRDPIERFKSGYAHQITTASKGRAPQVSFNDALSRSRYAPQVERLLRHFPREQMLIRQYERCRNDAAGEYARTLRFLGVADDYVPEDLGRMAGSTTALVKKPLWPELRDTLTAELEPDVVRLAGLVEDLDLSLWPNFSHLADGAPASAARLEAPVR